MTLKEQLEQGEYEVDTRKVADAILRNPLWLTLLAAYGKDDQHWRPATNWYGRLI